MASTIELYTSSCETISEVIIKKYSTSFYVSSLLFSKHIRSAIFNIYGFVRVADEIVDTFHNHDKLTLLNEFESNTFKAIHEGISLNPILHSFQHTVNTYQIKHEYIQAFLQSMRYDINKKEYRTVEEMNEYIYGSAEVVGLMCLQVFCNSTEQFNTLKPSAIKLGAAFQKVNFLRDIQNDIETLQRTYFPNLLHSDFTESVKKEIIQDIQNDFADAFQGIKQLPHSAKLAVYTAFLYYQQLLKKLDKTPADQIAHTRIRVSNSVKFLLVVRAFFACVFRFI